MDSSAAGLAHDERHSPRPSIDRVWHPDLDPLDQRIIERLSADASLSNTALAGSLGVAKTTIGARVKRLAERGFMRVIAETDVHAAGYSVFASVAIETRGRDVGDVAADLAAIPEVILVSAVVGRYQLMVSVIARDSADLLQLLERSIAATRGVEEIRCSMSLDTVRYLFEYKQFMATSGPDAVSEAEERYRILRETALADRVDDLDLRIVAYLQADGRLSLREIARQLGVAQGTVGARVKRLDRDKLLRRVAAVDPLAVGHGASAFIGIRVDARHVSRAANALVGIPEVGLITIVLGEFQILAAAIAHDRADLFRLINEEIAPIEGVRVHEVTEVVHSYKHDLGWTLFVD